MAKIYISYQRDDQEFVSGLAKRLKDAGHTLAYDYAELSPGVDWRKALDMGLKTSDIFIVVFSQNANKSQYVLAEVGAARAYALESNRMLLLPLVVDEMPLPLTIQDILAIVRPDRNLDVIVPEIERAISSFIGRRAAIEAAATTASEKIQVNVADYIRVAIASLERSEKRDRWLSYGCYFIGFVALNVGMGAAICALKHASDQANPGLELLTLVILKTVVIVGLLGAVAKYTFTLGKSYSSESLKSSDRIHAIRFGEFYLRAFGNNTNWAELKEVFQHWNIDRNSSFASIDASQFDPKIVELLSEFAKAIGGKQGKKKG